MVLMLLLELLTGMCRQSGSGSVRTRSQLKFSERVLLEEAILRLDERVPQ